MVATAVIIGLTANACSSVESTRDSKEVGSIHRFTAPYRQILDAMPAALEAVKLRIIESTDVSPTARVIITRHPSSALYLGYYVRVTIKELNAGQTEVEVLSKGQFADLPSSGRMDNSSDLFLEIGKRVYGT
jgi:hypothetical protein